MSDDQRLLQWRNLPMELRLKRHWLVAHPVNKNPLFNRDNQFYNASVSIHASLQWMTFEEATTLALMHNLAIGFVLKEDDDVTCIDLDVKPNTTKEALDLYDSVVHSFDSYTERSIGGQGIHIWCRGSIGLGRKRQGVEIYSQNRFMICTGNVIVFKEQLESRQEKLNNMISQMPMSADYSEIVLEELPQIESDEDIGRKLWDIEDARLLWQGMWSELGHPSQSEGDLDLMVHLVRLSPSNEQCRRLFRQSGLGKRTKANRKDYIERTLRHSRYVRQCDLVFEDAGRRSAAALAAKYDADQLKVTANGSPVYEYPPEIETVTHATIVDFPPPQMEEEIDTTQPEFPPGGLGYLTRYFYNSSIYPNLHFSVPASISFMSGLCGRAWNTSTGLGLNSYNIVIGPSGMGKEEVHRSMARLVEICSEKFPTFRDFFYFGTFASGQALDKHFGLGGKLSFIQIISEFGNTLKGFSNAKDTVSTELMRAMIALHSKSGEGSVSGAISYSDSTKNIMAGESKSYSFIGDTTPEVYESVNSFLISNGFMSRCNIFEYKGARSSRNRNTKPEIDPKFVEYLVLIAQIANQINSQKKPRIRAILSPDAQNRLDKFESFCDKNYNQSILNEGTDIEHSMWSRSAAKVAVLATLASILDTYPLTPQSNVISPIVSEAHWDYFERMVMNQINNFKTRQEAGDLGTGDNVQVKKLEMLIDEYVNKPIGRGYGVRPELQASMQIELRYMRNRAISIACFKSDGKFDDRKLNGTIKTLIDMGRLREIRDPGVKGSVKGILYKINM